MKRLHLTLLVIFGLVPGTLSWFCLFDAWTGYHLLYASFWRDVAEPWMMHKGGTPLRGVVTFWGLVAGIVAPMFVLVVVKKNYEIIKFRTSSFFTRLRSRFNPGLVPQERIR